MYNTRFWGEHHIPPRLRIKSGFYSLKETTTQVLRYYNEQNRQNQLNARLSRKKYTNDLYHLGASTHEIGAYVFRSFHISDLYLVLL